MKIRILLVDDEKEFVERLSKRLELRDYDVTVAYSGKEAVEKIRQFLFDVIILDVLMPEMSGIETLKQIKIIRPLAEVIMLTGHATVESALEGMKLGAFDYLMKPTEIEVLTEKINNAHQRKAEHEERIRMAKAQWYSTSPRSVLDEE